MRVDAADVRRVIGEGGNPGIAQRQSDDALAGQIPDVGDPDEGQHVVFTHRSQRQVAGNHEFVVALVVGKGGQIEGPRSEQFA